MKEKIVIQNAMKYFKEGKSKIRIGFYFLKPSDTDNFIGYSDVACYYDAEENFLNKIPKSMIFDREPVMATFEEKPCFGSSLNTRKILKSIEYKGNVINLL